MKKELKLASKIESLREVEIFVDEISESLNLGKSVYGNLLISVIEAVNNSIIHGNKLDESKYVELAANFVKTENLLVVTVGDQGNGFDYSKLPDPTLPDRLESINGRGIFLMKQLADNLIFNDSGSKVELHFKV